MHAEVPAGYVGGDVNYCCDGLDWAMADGDRHSTGSEHSGFGDRVRIR